MNVPALAGLGLVLLAASKRMSPEEMARREAAQEARRRESREPIRKAGFVGRKQKVAKHAHKHVFVIGGVEFKTKDTLRDPKNPNRHTHLLEAPIFVMGSRPGTSRRIRLKVATTFDPFGPNHTHKAALRGKVFTSGRPIR